MSGARSQCGEAFHFSHCTVRTCESRPTLNTKYEEEDYKASSPSLQDRTSYLEDHLGGEEDGEHDVGLGEEVYKVVAHVEVFYAEEDGVEDD